MHELKLVNIGRLYKKDLILVVMLLAIRKGGC
jgi:hypothetical protein